MALEKRDLLHAEPQKLLLAHPGQAVRRCVAVEHMPVAVQGDQALVQLIQDGRHTAYFPPGVVARLNNPQGPIAGLAQAFLAGIEQDGGDAVFPAYFHYLCAPHDHFRLVFQGRENGFQTISG